MGMVILVFLVLSAFLSIIISLFVSFDIGPQVKGKLYIVVSTFVGSMLFFLMAIYINFGCAFNSGC